MLAKGTVSVHNCRPGESWMCHALKGYLSNYVVRDVSIRVRNDHGQDLGVNAHV